MKTNRVYPVITAALLLADLLFLSTSASIASAAASATVAASEACASSSPSSGGYTVTVCLAAPAGGSTLTGVTTVTATASVTGTNPGVQRMIFYLSGAYLLIDYQSPYTFRLPTARWVDGSYTLSVQALMRDKFTSSKAAEKITFHNGVTSPPVNSGKFRPTSGTTPAAGTPFVVMATGDGAGGESNSARVISLIAAANPNLFLYLGDVYEKGSPTEFYNWYGTGGSFFSRFRAITDPTIGNHEYTSSSNAAGYFDYWNNVPNYYSFNAGGWHFVNLNANGSKVGGVQAGSPQYNWLKEDLAANAGKCIIAYYHQPLFDIGPEGPDTSLQDIWALMAQNHVTIVLNGHDHNYQRWRPLNGSGQLSSSGITEFVAGGGGHGLQTIQKTDSRVAYFNSHNPAAFGALKLSLTATAANFSYQSITGSVIDSGTVSCKK